MAQSRGINATDDVPELIFGANKQGRISPADRQYQHLSAGKLRKLLSGLLIRHDIHFHF